MKVIIVKNAALKLCYLRLALTGHPILTSIKIFSFVKFFRSKTLFQKLWPLLNKRAKLDLRSTKRFVHTFSQWYISKKITVGVFNLDPDVRRVFYL